MTRETQPLTISEQPDTLATWVRTATILRLNADADIDGLYASQDPEVAAVAMDRSRILMIGSLAVAPKTGQDGTVHSVYELAGIDAYVVTGAFVSHEHYDHIQSAGAGPELIKPPLGQAAYRVLIPRGLVAEAAKAMAEERSTPLVAEPAV
jgi:glyoxylase-like metal-dependent hydrolase (beta-lactamase superfamily II)